MQVETQNQNAVVAQNRGYWGYEEIDPAQLKKIAGAGDGGCGGGCGGCGGDSASDGGSSSGSVAGDGVSSQGTPSGGSAYGGGEDADNAIADAAFDCFDAASVAPLACLALDAFTSHTPAVDNGHTPAPTDSNGNGTNGGIY